MSLYWCPDIEGCTSLVDQSWLIHACMLEFFKGALYFLSCMQSTNHPRCFYFFLPFSFLRVPHSSNSLFFFFCILLYHFTPLQSPTALTFTFTFFVLSPFSRARSFSLISTHISISFLLATMDMARYEMPVPVILLGLVAGTGGRRVARMNRNVASC